MSYVVYVMEIVLVMYSCAHVLCHGNYTCHVHCAHVLCHGNYTCHVQLCTCLMFLISGGFKIMVLEN